MRLFPLKAIICLSLSLLLCRVSKAQVFSNDDAVREANFVTRVVQLDEFIHRFNNDSSSEIRRYYLSHHRPWTKSREQMIRSLFNYGTQRWDSLQVDRFVRHVTDSVTPGYLDFWRSQWFAEARCIFEYRGVRVAASLILRVQFNPDGSAQWVITAVKPDFGLSVASKKAPPIPELIRVSRKQRFIQPAANDTYFTELGRDFADKRGMSGLFDGRFLHQYRSGPFYQALLNDRLQFVAVKRIKYHFLQVDGWVFTVEHFERATRNSGWLITSIREVNGEEQLAYTKKLIGE